MNDAQKGRRAFLAGAGAGAAAAAFPAPAIAQGRVQWRMLTTWPKNFPGVGTAAQRIADRIGALSDGRMEVKLFAAGEFVPAFEMFDAVREGKADMGHDAPYYWIAKQKACAFFCSVPGGLTPWEHMGWVNYGGGQALWDELYAEFGLRAWLAGNAGMQMVGWFKNPIASLADLQGLKIRMAGLQSEVLSRLGATTVNLPGGEVMPALQSGVIDAAEWGGPWMDLAFGFHKIASYCYGPGVHEPGAAMSLVVNRERYDALPESLQRIVRAAAEVENSRLLSEFTAKNALAMDELANVYGVSFERLPDDVLRRWFEISEEVNAEAGAGGDINRRIYESWQTFRRRSLAIAPLSTLGFMQSRTV